MRYSILGANVKQVQSAGGVDIKETRSGIIFASLDENQAEMLRKQGCILRPVKDIKLSIMPPLPPVIPTITQYYIPAELLLIARINKLHELGLRGQGYKLAIVDTGIRASHNQVGGRVIYQRNFTPGSDGDVFDHGTGVASLALAAAPELDLLDLKALNDQGVGTDESVILALDEVIALHDDGSPYAPQAVNLSLGAVDDNDPYNPLRVACRAVIERGIWIFAAAGNSGPQPMTIMSPACERDVVAVGSAGYLQNQSILAVSNFSSRGPTLESLVKPDMVFFGENIQMASCLSDDAVVVKGGTSFATPLAAAILLLYRQGLSSFNIVSPDQVITSGQMIQDFLPGICLHNSSIKDTNYGYGLPHGDLILKSLGVTMAVPSDFVTVAGFMICLAFVGTAVGTLIHAG